MNSPDHDLDFARAYRDGTAAEHPASHIDRRLCEAARAEARRRRWLSQWRFAPLAAAAVIASVGAGDGWQRARRDSLPSLSPATPPSAATQFLLRAPLPDDSLAAATRSLLLARPAGTDGGAALPSSSADRDP